MWKKLRSIFFPVLNRIMGQKGADRRPARFQYFDVGFHGDRYLLQVVDMLLSGDADYFIETGTNVGSTLAHVARTYPAIDCYSCEPDVAAFERAAANTAPFGNVSLFNLSSQEFLQVLEEEYVHLFARDGLFWLDAHGYGFEWPLKEELAFISKHFASAWILIDDFKVPGLEIFGYDEYQGQICSFDFVKDALNPENAYRVFYPDYRENTSPHHSLRGWGLIEFGHEEWRFPHELQDKVRQATANRP